MVVRPKSCQAESELPKTLADLVRLALVVFQGYPPNSIPDFLGRVQHDSIFTTLAIQLQHVNVLDVIRQDDLRQGSAP